MHNSSQPIIAISSCLLGNHVRYDGLNKGMPEIYQYLQKYFELLAVCPEVEIGLSVPRPALRLSGDPHQPMMTGRDDETIDVTAPMHHFCNTRPQTLQHVCGYIFKSRSPSCGLRNIPVFRQQEVIELNGRGLFAEAMVHFAPDLPVVDETELDSTQNRNHFVQQVLNYNERHPEIN